MTLWSPNTGSWHDRSNEPGKAWPRHNGLQSRPQSNMLMSRGTRSWISEWDPENKDFWDSTGKYIARRNLIWSIAAEFLGFSIWLLWSIVAVKLPQAGFHYTTDQLFQLVALPGLIGSLARFPVRFRSSHIRRSQLDHLQCRGAFPPHAVARLFRDAARD